MLHMVHLARAEMYPIDDNLSLEMREDRVLRLRVRGGKDLEMQLCANGALQKCRRRIGEALDSPLKKGHPVLREVISPRNEKAFEANSNNQNMARVFPDLVGDWDKRWAAEKEFLLGVFDDTQRRSNLESRRAGNPEKPIVVLDAAMGIGVEVVKLQRERIAQVIGNELDPYFREIAEDNIDKNGADVEVTGHNWMVLDQALKQGSVDNLLCLGNSFNYLPDEESQVAVLENFRNVLSREGRIVIDLRNWKPVVKHLKELMASGKPVDNLPFNGEPMYNGKNVRWSPHKLYDGGVTYEYSNGETAGRLTMSTLYHEDMMRLIDRAGGLEAEVYSDFKPGLDDDSKYRQYVLKRKLT